MVSLSGHSVYPHDILSVCCLLTVSQAYVNVALDKRTSTSSSTSSDSINAVRGRTIVRSGGGRGGKCAKLELKDTATGKVDLITIHSIHHITIHFKTDNMTWGPSNDATGVFLGFSVYISNTTNRREGTLCYRDDNFTLDTIPAVFTTKCPVHGQYVIYYNERRPDVIYPGGYSAGVSGYLCELEVYGCPATGYFGFNCSVPCSDVNCQYCHIETGTCQGCKPGYKGHRCEMACEGGTYGDGCKEKCGLCRDVNQCSINNGTCLTGCDASFKGDLCKTVCDRGSYGYDCNDTCGHCRDVDQCSLIKGTCFTGCDAGYQGDLCKTSCDRGSYGSECNATCGHCRDINQCSNINGTCKTGCAFDYQGDLCKTLCPVGYFGQDCSETCINSYTCDGCNDASGSCDYGCRSGWIGYFCQKNFEQSLNLGALNLSRENKTDPNVLIAEADQDYWIVVCHSNISVPISSADSS